MLRSAAAGAGAVGTVGVVAGQEGTDGGGPQGGQRRAVIPEQQQYDQTVTGFFIHIGPGVDPTEASVADNCEFVDWTNDETLAYDARLIDRKADPEETRITLYLNDRVAVEPGMLFIINDREQCQSGYLGIYLEPVGIDLAQLRSRDFTPSPAGGGGGGGVGAAGPGLGIASGLAGLLGAGWLFGRRRE
ncbi:hypothetical protein NDI56_13605 [Haloarcula sp. S1CR25-12]|uniref:PGF-CTERM sorting domain-containing protein n=1 Tax=Haloarcula saliterrae TaxID=2950534 RepID=A0ABU2FFF0_9EURY|nr:hypothetical protein [Haloarcula sp. S1CR25-12]MDS0260435.1 hypothetical protein [Haloarcula sp. S1CR25-12]